MRQSAALPQCSQAALLYGVGGARLETSAKLVCSALCMPRRPFNRILVAQHVTMPQMWISCLVAVQVGGQTLAQSKACMPDGCAQWVC